MKSRPVVQTLARGLEVLLLFNDERREWSVSDISAELQMSLATTYRIVHTLEDQGFLERVRRHGPVRLGLRLARLGWLVQSGLDLGVVARPTMERLAKEVGETAVLMVPREEFAVCIQTVDGSFPIRPKSLAVGDRQPYNAGAVSLAILAFLPDESRERVFRSNLPAITPRTVTDPARLRERCRRIRETGVAYSNSEVIAETAAVAAPIFGADGVQVLGAIGLTGIVERIVDLEGDVAEAAQLISSNLGDVSRSV